MGGGVGLLRCCCLDFLRDGEECGHVCGSMVKACLHACAFHVT